MARPQRWSILVPLACLGTVARADDRDETRAEPVVIAGKIPADLAPVIGAGFYLAGRTAHERVKPDATYAVDEAFYIARIDRTGVRQILRDQEAGGAHRGGIGMVWATPTTLITSDFGRNPDDRGVFSIVSLATAGAPKIEAVTLHDADWKLTKAEVTAGVDNIAVPVVTRAGEVWLAMCLKKHHEKCERTRYLRVFGGARTTSDRKPAGIVSGRVASEFVRPSPDNARPDVSSDENLLAGLPDLQPPAGLAVTLRKPRPGERSGGFACTSPGGSHTSPDDDVGRDPTILTRPDRVRWVLAKPPIFAVNGVAFDSDGQSTDYVEFFRACASKAMDGFRALRPRIWAENVVVEHPGKRWIHHEWRISIDETVIGNIAGDSVALTVAPPS